MVQNNQNPIQTRIGIISIGIAIVLFLIDSKKNSFSLDLLNVVLFFGGTILATYGLTKIDIKEDKSYQKFIRITSKILLIFICIFLVLGIVSSIFQFSSNIIIGLFILFAVFVIFIIITQIIFYIKTYKYMKKINSKLNAKQKRNQLILLIICLILGLIVWYVFKHIILKTN